MNPLRVKLDALISKTSLTVTEQQREQLVGYVQLLDKWNKAYNLTSVRDPMEMLVKHILDSLVVSPHLVGERFIDVGSGPGLPGIPLAIMHPDKEFDPESGFDGVLSRAFASMTDMVNWCQHLPKPNAGVFLALKGVRPDDEITLLPEWCSVTDIKALQVPELEGERHLVILSRKG